MSMNVRGPRHSSSVTITHGADRLSEGRGVNRTQPQVQRPSDDFGGVQKGARSHHGGKSSLCHPSEGMQGGGASDLESLKGRITELENALKELLAKLGGSGEGTSTDGTSTDGTSTDGTSTDGTSTDGTSTDGTSTDGTSTDGTAGASDAQGAEAAKVLQENFDQLEQAAGINGKDGLLGVEDLKAIQNDPNASQALKDACKYYLDNPEAFAKLSGASGQAREDGLVTMEDLAAAASGATGSTGSADPTDSTEGTSGTDPVEEQTPTTPSTPPTDTTTGGS
jgi:hypothetical protein